MDTSRLEQALVAAHNAGDVKAATALATELRRVRAPADPLSNPNMATEGMSGFDKFMAGAGKAVADVGRGAGQYLGIVSPEDVADSRKLDAPLMRTGAGMAGNIGGNIAMTLLPGSILRGAGAAVGTLPNAGNIAKAITGVGNAIVAPKTVGQGAAVGAGVGALQPSTDGGETLFNVLLGGGLGGASTGIANAFKTPQVSPEVALLKKEGVTMTPGQIMGGMAQKIEDKATSIPIIGDAITAARRNSIEQMNKAALNRALNPIGQSADDIGREGVAGAQKALSKAYDDLLPNMKFVADQQFEAGIGNLKQMAKSLPGKEAREFNNILKREVYDRLTPQGLGNGETLKEIESGLGKAASRFEGAADGYQQQLGDALKEALKTFRDGITRSNPQLAEQLQNINKGYANLTRIEMAAGRTGSKEGIFSPAALSSAVKQGDKTVRDRAFAGGRALMQDLSDAGEKVLGSKYPDSGTAGRALLASGALGAGYISPIIPFGLGALATPYLPGARSVIQGLLTAERPAALNALGQGMQYGAPLLTAPTLAQIAK